MIHINEQLILKTKQTLFNSEKNLNSIILLPITMKNKTQNKEEKYNVNKIKKSSLKTSATVVTFTSFHSTWI